MWYILHCLWLQSIVERIAGERNRNFILNGLFLFARPKKAFFCEELRLRVSGGEAYFYEIKLLSKIVFL